MTTTPIITADELRNGADAILRESALASTPQFMAASRLRRAADALDAAELRVKFLERVWEVTDPDAYDAACRDAALGRRLWSEWEDYDNCGTPDNGAAWERLRDWARGW